MLFKRSDTSKNSNNTRTGSSSTRTGSSSASASAGTSAAYTVAISDSGLHKAKVDAKAIAKAQGQTNAQTKDQAQALTQTQALGKSKKTQSKNSQGKSCNSSAMAKERLGALIKNEAQDDFGGASVAERLKAVLKDSPRAKAALESEMIEPSIRCDEAKSCDEPKACFESENCDDSKAGDDAKFYAPVVVYTVEELERAQKDKAERIVVKGELAEKLKIALKGLRSIGAGSLNTLALCLSGAALLAPFTGGVSLGAAGTAMGTLGAALTATAIAAISAIGLALVIAVFKGYDEVKLGGGGVELVIKKHKDKK